VRCTALIMLCVSDASPAARASTAGGSGVEPTPRTVLARIAAITVGIRVILEGIGLVAVSRTGITFDQALQMWVRWDAGHYLRLAEVGYRRGTPPPDDPLFIVFFPGYPLVVRVVGYVVRDLVASGLLVSLAASIGAAYLLYRLVRLDAGHDEAWRAVLLLLAFPTAYFLAAPYTESLFLFAVLASVYAARTGGWLRASLAGMAATSTRVAGVSLLPALAFEAISSPARWPTRVRRLGWVAAASAGLLAYLGINWVVYDDPFWFLEVQRSHWSQEAKPPWDTIVVAASSLLDGVQDPTRRLIFWTRLGACAFAVTVLCVGARRLRVADSVYGWAGLVLVLSTAWLISLPRYVLVLYPLFMVGAKLTRSRTVLLCVIALSSVAQIWLFSRYVRGIWAF
jgi:hypothetical protein